MSLFCENSRVNLALTSLCVTSRDMSDNLDTIDNFDFLLDFPVEIPTHENNTPPCPSISEFLASQSCKKEQSYIDVTPFFTESQRKAAKKLGMPSSTFNKRWKEATCKRKWPCTELRQLEKELDFLQRRQTTNDVESAIQILLKKKKELSRPAFIRSDKKL